MNRRSFMTMLSGLPFLGWLKPKDSFPSIACEADRITWDDVRKAYARLNENVIHVGPSWIYRSDTDEWIEIPASSNTFSDTITTERRTDGNEYQ